MGGKTDKDSKPAAAAKGKQKQGDIAPPPRRASGAVSGTDVVAGDVTGPRIGLPLLPRRPAFFLAVHPERWVAGQDARVLPAFAMLSMRAGVEGQENIRGKLNWRPIVNRFTDAGWRVLNQDTWFNGESYVYSVPVQGGKTHLPKWVSAYSGSRRTNADRALLERWVNKLVKDGLIEPPSLQGLYRQLADAERAQMLAATRGRVSVIAERRSELLLKPIEALRKKIEEIEAVSPMVPTAGADTSTDSDEVDDDAPQEA